MATNPITISKAEAAKVFHRVGLPPEEIEKILSELPDPLDLDRDQAVMEKHGISRETLADLMGGSP